MKDTLQKAIRIAELNGYDGYTHGVYLRHFKTTKKKDYNVYPVKPTWENSMLLLLDHDFAKALWGEEPKPYALLWARLNEKDGLMPYFKPALDKDDPKQIAWVVENHQVVAYKWHLQQMVISDDPIAYLASSIGEGE